MKRISILIALVFFIVTSNAQFTISGKVTDEELNPLTGANITITNTYRGTTTNFEGVFKLTNLKPGTYEITFSFIGFQNKRESISVDSNKDLQITLLPDVHMADEVIVLGTRADSKTPSSFSNIDKDEIGSKNLGQDLPLLLNQSVSVVTTTDAGNGIGYTGMRIRGTDINRINVTINGIPFNDPESHGVYWVDIPDIASSTENIQIQRGVGTSSNGAASFGGTINLQTNNLNSEPFSMTDFAYGSFNTLKTNLSFGTGLLKNKFTLDGRLSKITSDGYIDRAWSDLKSFYLSGGYYSEKDIIRINIFSGIEETYQAWNGVPKVRLKNDPEGMLRYGEHYLYSAEETENMILSDSRTYNYYTYDNQIDHYQQNHYQMHFSHQFNRGIIFNSSLHYTKGMGYYEEYKAGEKLEDYNIADVVTGSDTISHSDIVRQKWLDNDFYGFTTNLLIFNNKTKFSFGGSWNNYTGRHFGEIIWAQYAGNSSIHDEWYRNRGLKKDFTVYGKINYQINPFVNLYTDLQYRGIRYNIKGINDDAKDLSRNNLNFDFFNPKAGIFITVNDHQNLYTSFAIANREPNRSNYVDAPLGRDPVSERLYDFEAGYTFKMNNLQTSFNFYNMSYKNQLVLTGEINDVGDPIMVNVPASYRRGLEIAAGIKITPILLLEGNLTLSRNKINNFNEYVDNFNFWNDPENESVQLSSYLGKTDISFSPEVVGSGSVIFKPFKDFSFSFLNKYVSRQYIDNTSSVDRSLDPYFINDLHFSYQLNLKKIGEISYKFLINNLFNVEYETNAWVYRYYYGNSYYTMDGYFPQAGINIIAGFSVKF